MRDDQGSSPAPEPRLRRDVGFIEALALSVGIMAPTAVLDLNGVLPAGSVGRAVPLSFALASVGVLFVSYGFVRLSRHLSHAGSTYAFVGITIGPRAGFVGGWALLATYIAFTVASAAEVGLFGGAFFQGFGLHVDWLILAIVAAALIAFYGYRDLRSVGRALLICEGLAVLLTVVLFAVIYVRILSGHAPNHQRFDLSPLTIPHGVSWSMVGLASVAGFLSFGGFEGAASLGEETRNPRRTIPRALIAIVLTLSILYVVGMFTQVIGFGTDKSGVAAFAASGSSLGDLANMYVGGAMANALNLGATLSAFGSALGTAVAGSRILFALGRDGAPGSRLGRVSERTGSPIYALAVVMLCTLVGVVAFRIEGTSSENVFFYLGTLGTLLLLVAYIFTNAGAIVFFFLRRRVRLPLWEAVFPIAGIVILGYVLYNNVYPVPASPYNVLPYLAAAWLILGGCAVLFAPGMAQRIGIGLTAETAQPTDIESVERGELVPAPADGLPERT